MATDEGIDVRQRDDLSALFRKRRALEEADMDITPMIDITFLLLIFFIVAAKIDDSSGVNLPEAKYGVPVAAKTSVVITVDANFDGSGKIFLGDTTDESARVSATDPSDLSDVIGEYAEKEMADERIQTVLIKAAGKLKHREVAKVMSAIGSGVDVEVVYVAVLEK